MNIYNHTLPRSTKQIPRDTHHTPGPWQASIGTRGASIHVANDANHPLSFRFEWNEMDAAITAEAQANALLISSAPDLLAALTMMVLEKADYMRINRLGDPEAQHTIRAARLAIAKATGGTIVEPFFNPLLPVRCPAH